MPNIAGVKHLIKQVNELKLKVEKVTDKIAEKQNWLDRQSDQYLESETGQEWQDYLYKLEGFIREIQDINTDDIESEYD